MLFGQYDEEKGAHTHGTMGVRFDIMDTIGTGGPLLQRGPPSRFMEGTQKRTCYLRCCPACEPGEQTLAGPRSAPTSADPSSSSIPSS